MNEEEPEQLQNIVNVQNVYPIWVTNQIRTVSRQFLYPPYKIVPHPISGTPPPLKKCPSCLILAKSLVSLNPLYLLLIIYSRYFDD